MGLAEMMYGTAQNAAQEQGQGLSQSLQQGAGLAMKKEELDIQTGQLQAKLGELKQAKISKWADLQEKQAMMPDGPAKQAYGKFVLPQAVNAMGISDLVHPVTQEMMAKDSSLATFVISGIRNGTIPPAILGDADKVASMAKAAHMDASGEDIKSLVGNYPKEIQAAYDEWLKGQNAKEVAGIKATGSVGYEKTVGDFTTKVQQSFKKVEEQKSELNSALEARDRLAASLAKDPTGKSASSVDMGAMLYSFLHTELGRVNATEIAHQTGLPGIENMSQDAIVKALGGVNPNAYRAIADRLNTAVQSLDQQRSNIDNSFEGELKARKNLSGDEKDSLRAIKQPFTGNLYRPEPARKYKLDGQIFTTESLQKFLVDHPDDPMAPKIKKALGIR